MPGPWCAESGKTFPRHPPITRLCSLRAPLYSDRQGGALLARPYTAYRTSDRFTALAADTYAYIANTFNRSHPYTYLALHPLCITHSTHSRASCVA